MMGGWLNIRNFIWKVIEVLTDERISNIDNADVPADPLVKKSSPEISNADTTVSSRVRADDSRLDYLDAPLSGARTSVKRILRGNFTAPPKTTGSVDFGVTVNPVKCILLWNVSHGKLWSRDYYSLATSCGGKLKADGTGLDWYASDYTDANKIAAVVNYQVVEFE